MMHVSRSVALLLAGLAGVAIFTGVFIWQRTVAQPEAVDQTPETAALTPARTPTNTIAKSPQQNRPQLTVPPQQSKPEARRDFSTATDVDAANTTAADSKLLEFASNDSVFGRFLGTSGNNSYMERRNSSDTLFDNASSDQITALYDFVRGNYRNGLNEQEWQAILGATVDFLIDEDQDTARLTEQLVSVLNDRNVPKLNRLHVVKRIPRALPRIDHSHEEIADILWQLASNSDDAAAATALSALGTIHYQDVHDPMVGRVNLVDSEKFLALAVTTAKHTQAAAPARIAGLQVINWLEPAATRNIAASIVKEDCDPTLALAAVAVLLESGQPEDIDLIRSVAESGKAPVSAVAARALAGTDNPNIKNSLRSDRM